MEDLADAVADWNRNVGGDRVTLQPWLEVHPEILKPSLPMLLWHLPSFMGRTLSADAVVCSTTCPCHSTDCTLREALVNMASAMCRRA